MTASDHTAPHVAQQLREATREEHAAVEALPLMQALAGGDVDQARYIQILHRHQQLVGGWERDQGDWLRTLGGPDWDYQWRAPLLHDDLAMLAAANAAPVAAPAAASEAGAWGMLYVIEGAQLGGRVIARGIRARAPGLASALRYFELGQAEPARWRHFQQRLARALPDAIARAAAATGARAMFTHFHHHLAAESGA